MSKYLPQSFEKKWLEVWQKEKLYFFNWQSDKKKFYNLVEWPYTSGDLHIGHWFAFTIPDVLARYKRMAGYNVFYPNGYDAFGLPAENAAIQRHVHPQDWTMKNIEVMTKQYQTMGTMIDWDYLVITCLPEYYRWNQWIFLKMFERGLIYRGKSLSNWCPSCQTVLANENVENGRCWRCDSQVIQKEIEQWFIKITDYADRLIWPTFAPLSGASAGKPESSKINWPVSVQVGQNNWIGRKEGINIKYKVVQIKDSPTKIFSSTGSPGQAGIPSRKNFIGSSSETLDSSVKFSSQLNSADSIVGFKHPVSKNFSSASFINIDEITCFTTRPDTNFGATFIVLAPEHPFVKKILGGEINLPSVISTPRRYVGGERNLYKNIKDYVEQAKKKSEIDRMIETRKKTGVFTGFYAVNDLNGRLMPIWISDFALANVGTGAVVGVPGHDIRDFEFAKEFGLEIVRVVVGGDGDKSPITKINQVQEAEGIMVNSGFLNGLDIHQATNKIMDFLEEKGWGKRTITYHLRDWSISRQRYWGTPVPMIHCKNCGIVPVAEKDLPIKLPYEVDFTPRGAPPLASNEKWMQVRCPKCGGSAQRDAETLDTFFDSSWYWFRYISPHYDKGPFDKLRVKKLTPVDIYFGGGEHTLGHTLYARFFTKFFKDIGLVDHEEFALKRFQHGVVLGPDGNRMSKSKGNVINPDEVIKEYGADTVRMYLCFMMPYDATSPWSTTTIAGVYRFLKRVWEIYHKYFSCHAELLPVRQAGVSASPKKILKPASPAGGRVQDDRNQEDKKLVVKLQKTIKKVTQHIENIKMNTAIAAMMEFLNQWESSKVKGFSRSSGQSSDVNDKNLTSSQNKNEKLKLSIENAKKFLQILAPFAPYTTEEIWRNIFGEKLSIHLSAWPKVEGEIVDEEIVIPVQVNGKLRTIIKVESLKFKVKSYIEEMALKEEKVKKYLEGKKYKVIYVQGKILNFVLK